MAAPLGNEFWKLRSKSGRDKLFSTPEDMWEAACEYFQWCVDNPLMSTEFVGKNARRELVPKVQAFTLCGLCSFLHCNTVYFNNFQYQLKDTDTYYKGFNEIITRIRETIYHQKFIHAAAGFLKENIIARELGLTEKTDNTNHDFVVEVRE